MVSTYKFQSNKSMFKNLNFILQSNVLDVQIYFWTQPQHYLGVNNKIVL